MTSSRPTASTPSSGAPGRTTRDPFVRILALLLLTLCTIIAGRYYWGVFTELGDQGPGFNDFGALWSFGRFAATGHAAEIYDTAALHRFQVGLTGVEQQYPYVYPPFFLLLLWPIGLLGFVPAYFTWVGGTFVLYALAAGSRWSLPVLLIAPATVVSVMTGQTGFLTGALLIGGFRLVGTRPLLAGVLFGLLAFKPQLGVLVPVALLSAGLWRPVIAAFLTIGVLMAVSSATFGPAIWPIWIALLPGYLTQAGGAGHLLPLMPTVTSNLLLLKVGAPVARGAQILVATVTIVLVWRGCRHRIALPMIESGSFLATPYAFIYDMPMLTHAVLSDLGDRHRRNTALSLPAILILAATFLLPLIPTLWEPPFPVGAAVLIAFFALLSKSA